MGVESSISESDWENARLGKFTASEIHNLLSDPKAVKDKEAGKFSDAGYSYIEKKLAEINTGYMEQAYGAAIEYGTDLEPAAARELKRLFKNQHVDYYGKDNPKFWDFMGIAGGSPDMIVDSKILIEIKCPKSSTIHLQNLIMSLDTFKTKRKIYYAQIQALLMFCKLEKAYFVSYDPRMTNEHLRLSFIEVLPDYAFQENIALRIERAYTELQSMQKELEARKLILKDFKLI